MHPSVPANNVAELVAYARSSTAKLSYGSAGMGSGHHITGELLKQKTGIDMNHVPYRGGGPAIQDLVAGPYPDQLRHAAVGAAAGRRRQDPHPRRPPRTSAFRICPMFRPSPRPFPASTLPTTWLGLLAPAGTPRPIVDKLNAAMLATLKKPDVIAKLKQQGLMMIGEGPDALDAKIKSELAFFGRTIPALGIQPE